MIDRVVAAGWGHCIDERWPRTWTHPRQLVVSRTRHCLPLSEKSQQAPPGARCYRRTGERRRRSWQKSGRGPILAPSGAIFTPQGVKERAKKREMRGGQDGHEGHGPPLAGLAGWLASRTHLLCALHPPRPCASTYSLCPSCKYVQAGSSLHTRAPVCMLCLHLPRRKPVR